MKLIEARAFAAGVTAEALMDDAGAQIAALVRQFYPRPGTCLAYYGKGNNGGDALVAARRLLHAGWHIELRGSHPEDELGELCLKKLHEIDLPERPVERSPVRVVLDGLLGIGASGELREPARGLVEEINRLRASGARVVAIDIPTGLNADTGEAGTPCVTADITATIGHAKRGLLADSATRHVGRLAVLPLAGLPAEDDGAIAQASTLAGLLPRRSFESHKTQYGRVGIVAGAIGTSGAAVMSATAALRAGAGLVHLYVRADAHPIIAAACPPEIMVRPVASCDEVLGEKLDVLAVGPGLGQEQSDEVISLIESASQPMVIDADGLNILSRRLGVLDRCAGPRLLTPHPGEMARLFEIGSRSRRETVENFVEERPVTLLLKGARTLVGERGRVVSHNTTGTPGMATGGMGDVLTGVCAALAAQGLPLYDAARVGAWLCGRAAELGISHGGHSEQTLAPTDLFTWFGAAFEELM